MSFSFFLPLLNSLEIKEKVQMSFTQDQIETLELLFKLTPAQRQRALQLVVQDPKPQVSPAIRRVTAAAPNSPARSITSDSSCTASSSGDSQSSEGKRLHSKNRVNRLTSKTCQQCLNSERMWAHLCGVFGLNTACSFSSRVHRRFL